MELAAAIRAERRQFQWPPDTHLALISARASTAEAVFTALGEVAHAIRALNSPVRLLGPAPAPMERRNRQYHGQLLILGKRPLLQWVSERKPDPGLTKSGEKSDVSVGCRSLGPLVMLHSRP